MFLNVIPHIPQLIILINFLSKQFVIIFKVKVVHDKQFNVKLCDRQEKKE